MMGYAFNYRARAYQRRRWWFDKRLTTSGVFLTEHMARQDIRGKYSPGRNTYVVMTKTQRHVAAVNTVRSVQYQVTA